MTDRLVNPPTLELIKDNESGMLVANTEPRHRPAMRVAFPSAAYTIIIPAIDIRVLEIMSAIRHDGRKLASPEVKSRKTSWVAPMGI
jgi:hypothetical protein